MASMIIYTCTCVECGKGQTFMPEFDPDLPDLGVRVPVYKTYTIECVHCNEMFSFIYKDGKQHPWHPPQNVGIRVYEKSSKKQDGDFTEISSTFTKTKPDGQQERTEF